MLLDFSVPALKALYSITLAFTAAMTPKERSLLGAAPRRAI